MWGDATRDDEAEGELLTGENISSEEASKGNGGERTVYFKVLR